MEMILTGNKMTAVEAYKVGLLDVLLQSTPQNSLAETIEFIEEKI